MLFCDESMCARIEREERDLVAAAFAAVSSRCADPILQPIGGGIAAFTEPGSPLNKVIGVGFDGVPGAASWAAIEQAHDERQAPVQVEIATMVDPACARELGKRGYELVGIENVLGLRLPTSPPAAASTSASTITIRRSEADTVDAWIDAVVTGFATPDGQGLAAHQQHDRALIERVMRDFVASSTVVRYAAWHGDHLVGGGAMRIGQGIAQLCGAATKPAWRRQGVQSALLTFRLAEAARLGCELSVVTTQPGSKSQQNAMRRGFGLLYSRLVFVRAPKGCG